MKRNERQNSVRSKIEKFPEGREKGRKGEREEGKGGRQEGKKANLTAFTDYSLISLKVSRVNSFFF